MWLFASVLVLLIWPTGASAQPYEFHAHFAGDDVKESKVLLEPEDLIPTATISQKLSGISILIKNDDISRSLRSQLEELTIDTTCGSAPCAASLNRPFRSRKVIALNKEQYDDEFLLTPAELDGTALVETVRFDLQSTFRRDFLCAEELRLRKEEGKLFKEWPKRILPFVKASEENEGDAGKTCRELQAKAEGQKTEADKAEVYTQAPATNFVTCLETSRLQALSTLAISGLEENGFPILYSFCENITKGVDWPAFWSKFREAYPAAGGDSPDALKSKQAMALAGMLKKRLEDKSRFGRVVIEPVSPGEVKMKIAAEHRFMVLRQFGETFAFKEMGNSDNERLEKPVDQDSVILVHNTDPQFCAALGGRCNAFFKEYISASIISQGTDGREVREHVDLGFEGRTWSLRTSLSKYLHKKVRFVLTYHNSNNAFDVLRTDAVSVEDFGLILSFPVISEVVSLVTKKQNGGLNPEDEEFQSSIPISWAFNTARNEGRHLALTAPFMVSYNPRIAPNLSHVIKVFPHISVIFPLSSETADGGKVTPDVAFGAGVALVDAFTLSWGLATSGDDYVMLGVSIPDLANILH
jgi:hypothetical protein